MNTDVTERTTRMRRGAYTGASCCSARRRRVARSPCRCRYASGGKVLERAASQKIEDLTHCNAFLLHVCASGSRGWGSTVSRNVVLGCVAREQARTRSMPNATDHLVHAGFQQLDVRGAPSRRICLECKGRCPDLDVVGHRPD